MKRLNLLGQQFGQLLVVEKVKDKWKCICSCGNEVYDTAGHLRKVRKSCGCLKVRANGEASFNDLYNRYKYRAEKILKVDFSISKAVFKNITSKNCHYCGVIPNQKAQGFKTKKYNGAYTYNGLDRLNNELGYSENNIVSCCGICNKAKRDLSQEEFTRWISRLVRHQLS